jgi:hypothetical protein
MILGHGLSQNMGLRSGIPMAPMIFIDTFGPTNDMDIKDSKREYV